MFISIGIVVVIEAVACDVILIRALAEGGGTDMNQQLGVFVGCCPQSILSRRIHGSCMELSFGKIDLCKHKKGNKKNGLLSGVELGNGD